MAWRADFVGDRQRTTGTWIFVPKTNEGASMSKSYDVILKGGTVKIAIPENFPPFGSLGPEGEYVGYDVDVAQLIAEDLGVKLELVPVDFRFVLSSTINSPTFSAPIASHSCLSFPQT